MADLGQVLREERERRGLKQQQVANRIGVSLRAVNGWENGATIPASRVPAIERALGIKLVRDGLGGYRLADPNQPPHIEGMEQVETTGDGGRVVLYFPANFFDGMTQDRRDQVIAAGRLSMLREAREIRDRIAHSQD
jgi:transcriptional regulator with XRE-family HTH domain